MKSEKLLVSRGRNIFFDMDGTITNETGIPDFEDTTIKEHSNFFSNVTPNKKIIQLINKLFLHNNITIYTTRIDLHEKVTEEWLRKHKVKYDNIIFNKPYYDYFIDDKNINPRDLE